jgi:ParB-like nuclease domain
MKRPSGQDRPEGRFVALGELVGSYSPRDNRVDDDHVLALAEVLDRVPPVVVDKATMKVIDGVHRVEASRRMGRAEIRAVFFEGSETDALVVAVQANIRHGKPLSRGERQAAAGALLRRCPERSDRWLAEVCGLSHSTVARIRQAADALGLGARTGRDGRRRPVDPTAARAAIAKALAGRRPPCTELLRPFAGCDPALPSAPGRLHLCSRWRTLGTCTWRMSRWAASTKLQTS